MFARKNVIYLLKCAVYFCLFALGLKLAFDRSEIMLFVGFIGWIVFWDKVLKIRDQSSS